MESVINQTYPYLEIIVVDDNDPSSNERYMTEDLLCKYLIDKRVIYIKHDRNKNGSAARNSGYKKSKGDYIMFLDDDDEFEKTKVEVQQKNLSGLSKDWGCNYTKYIKKLLINFIYNY
ncbi:glycosyltransferase [[Clostridium] innocuum]|uniref:Glycosyltransferase n=1 Tax=Clostridium innocuum TaxID=1522 RepID=A0AAP2URN4_CLOIN|nr:glycosyltransferase [[Clostridium] innocuum]MCR0379892.1 glycosyltransferase [[Clostridium] innocuum]